MKRIIKIGTRDSELALWQANTVSRALEKLGYNTQLVPVKSQGDIVLDKPLYEFGITGIFTKTLDLAMINGTIDIAVHSMKDVPTALPEGIIEGAVLKRARPQDLLLHKGTDFMDNATSRAVIATGSLRRRAQWLHRFPNHELVSLRGNLNTRLEKLKQSNWNGAIFAAAGLERINLTPSTYLSLDWMIPAPAQGAMLVVVKENDDYCQHAVKQLNHPESATGVALEREFLRELEGGCTAPIGALARMDGDQIQFHGALFSVDGQQKLEVKKTIPLQLAEGAGVRFAQEILQAGGRELMEKIKAAIKK